MILSRSCAASSIIFVATGFSSAEAAPQSTGNRDGVTLRYGYFNVTSAGAMQNNNTLSFNTSVEYNRIYTPRLDIRVGERIAKNSVLKRMQIQEFFSGARYYPWSLSTDFAGPIGSTSLRWNFMFKFYVEGQLAMGHYVADVIGEPPVYDLAANYYAAGGGTGCKFQIINGLALDVGANFQKGLSFGEVILDPTIIHVFLGATASF
jgi:hypothetical protein